jgi:P27 family predicted phage terminase small subunit
MRGRRPKPQALKDVQGNPGRRPRAELDHDDGTQPTSPKVELLSTALPFVQLQANAQQAYTLIGAELRRMNFVRPSDESLLIRYCDCVARYWAVTAALDELGGEVYEVTTLSGDKMQRMRPQFLVQQKLCARLEAMEDRLGLSPMARQSYMLRMANSPSIGASLSEPKTEKNSPFGFLKDRDDGAEDDGEPKSPIGLLKKYN